MTDVSELVRAVAQFAHLVGDAIVQGSATAHMVPAEQADGECKNCSFYYFVSVSVSFIHSRFSCLH